MRRVWDDVADEEAAVRDLPKWFEPDPRVGVRQCAWSAPECQRKRRAKNQAAWLARQPEYFVARRIAERAKRREETGRDVAPMRAPGPMAKVPWQLAQDEFGVQLVDFLWQFTVTNGYGRYAGWGGTLYGRPAGSFPKSRRWLG